MLLCKSIFARLAGHAKIFVQFLPFAGFFMRWKQLSIDRSKYHNLNRQKWIKYKLVNPLKSEKGNKDKVGHNIAFFGALLESDTDGHKDLNHSPSH